MRAAGKRLPCMLPRGKKYLDNRLQFIHVDDMARVLHHILQREPEPQRLTVLERRGQWRAAKFCAMHRDGAGEVDPRARKMGDAAGSSLSVEAADFGDSS